MVDVICYRSGLDPATFVMAEDHPPGDAESKPDFKLSCKEFDILCEHKLDSDLGAFQLERYLKLPAAKPTNLVLISNRSHDISDEVLQLNNYLRPKDTTAPFFCWEDFYPVIAKHNEFLAQDFLKYMSDLGMAPCPLPEEWAQLFESRDIAERFYESTQKLRTYFAEMGALCKVDPSRLGFQVKLPNPWLHLLYFYVSETIESPAEGIDSPYFIALVYVKESELKHIDHLVTSKIPTKNGLIFGREKRTLAAWDKNLVLSYECIGSLENYINGSSMEVSDVLLGFGAAVYEHVAASTD